MNKVRGLMWYEVLNPDDPIEKRVENARAAYKRKFGELPDEIFVNDRESANVTLDESVKRVKWVLPCNCFVAGPAALAVER